MEHHASGRNLRIQYFKKVPGNGFSFAVFIGSEVEGVSLFQQLFEISNGYLAAFAFYVEGLKAIINVNTNAGPGFTLVLLGYLVSALREISNMAHRRFDNVVVAEDRTNGLRLRWRLHNDESLTHSFTSLPQRLYGSQDSGICSIVLAEG